MNPEVNETQPQNPQDDIQMTNDELAAAMGYMTTLGDQQMQAEQQEVEAQNEEVEQQEESVETETEVGEPEPQVYPEQMKGEMMEELKKEIPEMLKSVLKEMLNEDESF